MPFITTKFLCLFLLNLMLVLTINAQKKNETELLEPALIKEYQQTISPEKLYSRLSIIASDSFGGRGTGQPGQKMAADYIVSVYRSLNIPPVKKSYLQTFPLFASGPLKTEMNVYINGSKKIAGHFSASHTDDLFYYSSGGAKTAKGSVVFAGYGIADDTLGYNDLAVLKQKNISVKNKWVMILDEEPSEGKKSLLPTKDNKLSVWSQGFSAKRMGFWQAGEQPLGILIVTDLVADKKRSFEEDAKRAAQNNVGTHGLSFIDPSGLVLQAYAISSKMADQILQGSGHSITELKKTIDQQVKPVVFDVPAAMIDLHIEKKPTVPVSNIFAFLEGSDPVLKKEVIVVSAHYDGLGTDTSLKGDQIFNGAADDGSGTVGVLQIAEAFKKAKDRGYGPGRSVLFANFVSEEIGLLGSHYFTMKDPLIPLKDIAADINLDGVAGIDSKQSAKSKNYVFLYGATGYSEDLKATTKKVKELMGIDVDIFDAPRRMSSDHESFWDMQVPALDFTTGYVDHIHEPGDEINAIDFSHFTNLTQLAFATIWHIANQSAAVASRPKIVPNGYVCGPCGLACDKVHFSKPGFCPNCLMLLVPDRSKTL